MGRRYVRRAGVGEANMVGVDSVRSVVPAWRVFLLRACRNVVGVVAARFVVFRDLLESVTA